MSDKSGADAIGKGLEDARTVGEAARQASSQAGQAAAQAVDHARDVAQDAQSRAASLASAAGDRATATMQAQKEGLADRLQDVAQAVHRSGEQLEGHQDWIAELVERGADELTTLANTLRTNDLRSVMGSLEDLSRRQPALFVGASLAAGFALARIGRVAAAGASRADLPHRPASSQEAHAPEVPRERE